MHQHRGSVALQIAQLAVGYRGQGKDGIAVLRGGAGLAQADHQVFNQLGKMASTLVIAKRNVVEFARLLYPSQPVSNDSGNTALQDRTHSLLFYSGGRPSSSHLFADEFGEPADFEWFYHDFVRLQEDSRHGALHIGVAAD